MKIYEVEPGEKEKFVPSNTKTGFTYPEFLSQCSESIAAMKEAKCFLYRGMQSAPSTIFIGSPRKDRTAMDTNQKVSDTLDKFLYHSGFTALRYNSIFCSGSASVASNYGKKYLIFPKNGFSLTWSSRIDDFTQFIPYSFEPQDFVKYTVKGDRLQTKLHSRERSLIMLIDDLNEKAWRINDPKENSKKYALTFIETFIRTLVSKPQNFVKQKLLDVVAAFEKDYGENPIANYSDAVNEYLILADEYRQLSQHIPSEEVVKSLRYSNTDLAAAITSKNEIMIKGEYYAFSAASYQQQLFQALLK